MVKTDMKSEKNNLTELKKWTTPILLVLFFIFLNLFMYGFVSRRLSNNFGSASTAKMVDVAAFLPFEEESQLVRIDSSLKFKDKEGLPILDGAAALVPVYAAFIDNVYPEGSVKYEGGSFSDDNFYGENFSEDSLMQYKNTVRGYRAIVDGDTDLFFCVKPSAEQAGYAEEQGVTLEYVHIGREAFVFFVNTDNPVENLTTDQIRQIYAGRIRNWREVGGSYRIINPVTRMEGSGSQNAMNAFMGDTPYGMKSPFAFAGGSIGYSFRYYLSDMVGNTGVRMLSVNGVSPDTEHIKDGSYPIVTDFYAIYRSDNDNPYLHELLEWILSEEGQEIIERTGYTGIN